MALLANKIPFSLKWFNAEHTKLICAVINETVIRHKEIVFLLPSEKPFHDEVIRYLEERVFLQKWFRNAKQVKYYNEFLDKELILDDYLSE